MNLDFSKPQFTREKIAYYSFGDGNKILLLVHGSFGSGVMWMRQIPKFLSFGYKVISLDLQGHGNSQGFDLAKTSMDDYASNIKSVLNVISSKPILIGHSMSGLTVLMIARDGLIDRIVAIDPSPSKEIQGEKSTEGILNTYNPMEAGMPKTSEEMMKAMPDVEPEMFPKLASILGMESGYARKQRKLGIIIPKEKLDSSSILFLGAELGNSLPFGISKESTRNMAKYYNKKYIEVSGASHPGMLIGKHAEKVSKEIIDWLTKSIVS